METTIKQTPRLLVKESDKTPEWIESHLTRIAQTSINDNLDNDILCWAYYHNKKDPAKTEYLTKIGDNTLPAEVRRTPRQRPYLDRLSSQQQRRPFVFSVVLSDKKSIEEKYLDQINDYVNAIEDQAQFVHYETSFQIQEIQGKIAEMQQMAQQQPQNAEEAAKIGELKKTLPRIINNFQYATAMLQKKDALSAEQVQKMQHYHKYEKKDWKELIAQKTLLKLRNELDINTESTSSFINGEVTGREYYYVDYIEGYRLPVFESLNPSTVKYPKISSVKWVQEGPWCSVTDYMSYDDVIIKYGKAFEKKYSKDILETLEHSYSENTSSMMMGRNGEAYFTEKNTMYSGSDGSSYGIKVERIWFKVPRNIKVKYTPNPFEEGIYFRHFIQNKEIIDKAEWKFNNGFYINKKDETDFRREEDVETINSNKGESFADKYTNDLYSGVVINDKYVVNEGKNPFTLRDIDRHGNINLPVFGKTYASMVDQPYSLIMATIDLQELYDIVTYHEELMLALSGTKTTFNDLRLTPSTMTDTERTYQKKIGEIPIETVGPDGRKMSDFSNWQMFDLSVSASIGLLGQLKLNIDETMGDVIGVTRQEKGRVISTDQVGTYNTSIKQASLLTEIRFAEHDLIEGKALTHCLNLALTYCYKDGETFGINNDDLSGEIINIPANILNKVRFNCIVGNNTDEGQGVEDLKTFIGEGWKAGQLSFGNVAELWGLKTLTEMKQRAIYFAEKAQEIAAMGASRTQEAENEKEKLKIQLNNELLAPWKEQEMKLKQMELDIKEKLGSIQAQILSDKNVILQKQVEQEGMIKGAKVQNEKVAEDNAVAINDKHLSNDEQIRMLEIQVNSLMEDAKLKHDNFLSDKKMHVDNAKNMILNQKQTAQRANKPS